MATVVTTLARPAVVALVLTGAALLLHPAVRSEAWMPRRDAALAALLLLATTALVLRAVTAPRRLASALLAVGAVLALGAVGADGLRGYQGTLSLVPGQSRSHFDEVGPDGRSLGLRPLGFNIGLAETLPGGRVSLALSGEAEPVVLSPEHALSARGFRFGRPRLVPTGAAARLSVVVSGGGQDLTVDVTPGRPTTAGDLTLTLQEFFPDFALDDQQQPYTRSREPRNPGALLAVESPRGVFRVFVLRSMPGVHRVEQLGRSFALRDVEPEAQVEIAVHRDPFAAAALFGALLALAGVVLGWREP